MIVTKQDVIAAGFCAAGLREWCRLNGIPASALRDGMDHQMLLDTGCELAAQVVEVARRRAAKMNTES